jgi:lipoprotein-anchoring transpeptidase ErfK/SrfK
MHLTHVVWIGEDGTAIHGTTQVDKLGSRASHGCIRLAGDHAATFYRLVEAYGIWNTEVVVVR